MSDAPQRARARPATAPQLGARYLNGHGSILTVTDIEPDNPLGREVRGRIGRIGNGSKPERYSTTLEIFADHWNPE